MTMCWWGTRVANLHRIRPQCGIGIHWIVIVVALCCVRQCSVKWWDEHVCRSYSALLLQIVNVSCWGPICQVAIHASNSTSFVQVVDGCFQWLRSSWIHELVVTWMKVVPADHCVSQKFPHAVEEYLSMYTCLVLSLNPLNSGLGSLHCLFHHSSWDMISYIVNCYLCEEFLVPLVSIPSLKHNFKIFCGFPLPSLYLFAWLWMMSSFILRQLFTKLITTSCFLRTGVPNIMS